MIMWLYGPVKLVNPSCFYLDNKGQSLWRKGWKSYTDEIWL